MSGGGGVTDELDEYKRLTGTIIISESKIVKSLDTKPQEPGNFLGCNPIDLRP